MLIFLIVSSPRLLTNNPTNTQNIRQLITEKINRQEETLTRLINQHQSVIDDHNSGRKLLTDEDMEYHKAHINSLRRKLAIAKQKDPIVSFVSRYIYTCKIYLCSIALRYMYLTLTVSCWKIR
jgi:hypothetical protein